MQPQIKLRRGVYDMTFKARIVNVGESDRRLRQYLSDVVIPPRFMSEFHNIARIIRYLGNNAIQVFFAKTEVSWELKKKILMLILKIVTH